MSRTKRPKEIIRWLRDNRHTLEDNRIYFEVADSILVGIAAVLLGLMALFLTWHANSLADDANTLLAYELRIMEKELMPVFSFEYAEERPDGFPDGATMEISISNTGHALYNLDLQELVFLAVEGHTATGQIAEVHIPVEQYLWLANETGHETGLLAKLTGPATGVGNIARLEQLRAELGAMAGEETGLSYLWVEPLVFVQASFEDVLDQPHVEIYEVREGGSERKLSESEADRVHDDYTDGLSEYGPADLYDLEAAQLLSLVLGGLEHGE